MNNLETLKYILYEQYQQLFFTIYIQHENKL